MKKVLSGIVGFVLGAVATVYTLAGIYQWRSSGMHDYIRASRSDRD